MAEETAQSKTGTTAEKEERGINEVSLEMMKFIALTTGYGKPSGTSAGFTGKAAKSGGEEYAEALLGLFEKCRETVKKGEGKTAS